MAVLDSKALFAECLDALGLSELRDDLVAKGWGTHGTFAYASSYTPGAADDSKFVEDVVVPLLGSAEHPQKVS